MNNVPDDPKSPGDSGLPDEHRHEAQSSAQDADTSAEGDPGASSAEGLTSSEGIQASTTHPRRVQSPADIEAQDLNTTLKQQHRDIGVGLIWGGAMLVVLACWLAAKFEEFPRAGIFVLGLAGLAPVGLGLFRVFLQKLPGGDLRQQNDFLLRSRSMLGLCLLSGGAVLLLLGILIGMQHWPDRVGEMLNISALGLVALWAGFRQRQKPSQLSLQDQFIKKLIDHRNAVCAGLIVLAVVLFALAIYTAYQNWDQGPDRARSFPRWGGSFFLGMVLVAGAFWFRIANFASVSALQARVFVLILGGVAGFILTLAAFAQACVWFDYVFTGGAGVWNGPESWRLWSCAYVELLGLTLMLGSSLLVQGDIRTNATLRRVLFGYQFLLNGFLLLALLVVLNYVIYVAVPFKMQWTRQGVRGLSPHSQDILKKLDEPTTIYVLMSAKNVIRPDIMTLLENCQTLTDKLKVQYIAPDTDLLQYDQLAQRYPELIADFRKTDDLGQGLFVVYGDDTGDRKPPHKLISPRKLLEFDPGQKGTDSEPKVKFLGEEALMTELQYFQGGDARPTVLFLQGDGELDITLDRLAHRRVPINEMVVLGGGQLVQKLRRENLIVKGLSFSAPEEGKSDKDMIYVNPLVTAKPEVPENTQVLVVAGPSRPMPPATLGAIDRYLQRGGKMVVFFDVIVDNKATHLITTGLEKLLQRYNVDVTNDYVFRFSRGVLNLQDDPLRVEASATVSGDNMLAKQFLGRAISERTVRVVRPGNANKQFVARPFLIVERGQQAWPESEAEAFRDLLRHMTKVLQEDPGRIGRADLPVAVTVTDLQGQPRMVVFGDTEFVANEDLVQSGQRDLAFNLIANSIDWLADRPGIGIRPKERGFYTWNPVVSEWTAVLVPGMLMIVLVIGLATTVWVVRRK